MTAHDKTWGQNGHLKSFRLLICGLDNLALYAMELIPQSPNSSYLALKAGSKPTSTGKDLGCIVSQV